MEDRNVNTVVLELNEYKWLLECERSLEDIKDNTKSLCINGKNIKIVTNDLKVQELLDQVEYYKKIFDEEVVISQRLRSQDATFYLENADLKRKLIEKDLQIEELNLKLDGIGCKVGTTASAYYTEKRNKEDILHAIKTSSLIGLYEFRNKLRK